MKLTVRDRFHAVMNFEPFDRLPVIEWANWWDKTLARWWREGLDPGLTDRYEICRRLGLDVYRQQWIAPDAPRPPRRGGPVAENEAAYDAMTDRLYARPRLDGELWRRWFEEQARGECVVWFTLEGFFWHPRKVLGIEPHLYAFYDAPDWLHRINRNLLEFNLAAVEELLKLGTPDFMTFAEDMSYNNGPMLSRDQFEAFVAPYYRPLVEALKAREVRTIVDSDGDITRAAPWFEAAGLDGILPLERQAGVDIDRLRAAHPRMRFIGHFDKMTMTRGEGAMRAEFERLLPAAAGGGFLPSCDHQTPPGVSFADYQLYLRLFREYAAEAGRRSRSS